jgi:short-subunit dehydrogenase
MSPAKQVFITGGSSGIGLALARLHAKTGDDLLLLARDRSKLSEAVGECAALRVRADQTVAGEPLDVTAFETMPDRLRELIAAHGLPDLLILSAGTVANKTFLDTSREEFDRVMAVNLGGSREVARGVLPAMIERGSGQIAFIGSSAGLVGIYGYSAYASSKFALTGFVQALRQELTGTGVSVNLVCPPEVDTPMVAAEAESALPQTRFLKDLAGTLSADDAAAQIARGLEKNQAVVIPGLRARLLLGFARHCPGLFSLTSTMLLRAKF